MERLVGGQRRAVRNPAAVPRGEYQHRLSADCGAPGQRGYERQGVADQRLTDESFVSDGGSADSAARQCDEAAGRNGFLFLC